MSALNRAIATVLPLVPRPVVRQVAGRYIAGETVEDAMRVAGALNRRGFRATMDILGEDVHTLEQARGAVRSYTALLEEIHRRKIDSNISIKLTQLGLKVDPRECCSMVDSIVHRARELRNFVRIDMEDSSCTSGTLEIYRSLRGRHRNVGVVVQAYLRRTVKDVESLDDASSNYRLCKGVYVEPPDIAYPDMEAINRNYVFLLERMLRRGWYVGIATHDARLVQEAMRLIRDLQLPATAYEFQMLLGVQEQLRQSIHSAGHPVRVYIPFGRDWYAYSIRRLRENPRLAGYVLRAMFRR